MEHFIPYPQNEIMRTWLFDQDKRYVMQGNYIKDAKKKFNRLRYIDSEIVDIYEEIRWIKAVYQFEDYKSGETKYGSRLHTKGPWKLYITDESLDVCRRDLEAYNEIVSELRDYRNTIINQIKDETQRNLMLKYETILTIPDCANSLGLSIEQFMDIQYEAAHQMTSHIYNEFLQEKEYNVWRGHVKFVELNHETMGPPKSFKEFRQEYLDSGQYYY